MKPKRVSKLALSIAAATIVMGLLSGLGRADTRIFSVETDRPGVTVSTVQRDGETLPVVGQGGGRAFFEIDAGSDTVPCTNQLAFTTSTGQRIEYIVDLCAHNWQVVLPLGSAEMPSLPPPAASPPTPPASLTIYTDDPAVGIDEVHIDGQPTAVVSRQGNAALVNLTPTQRSACEHDLGLALVDGRRIARMVDMCAPNGSIVVALDDESAAPAIPPPPISGPTASPPAPPPASAPPPPASGEIRVVDNLTWVAGSQGDRATLTYASSAGDDVAFFASCNRGSRQVEISIESAAPEVQPGASVPVTFTAGSFANTFTATGSDINALTGKSSTELTIATSDPFWPALIKEEFLVIQVGSAAPYALSLKGSSKAARPFVDACNLELLGSPQVPPGGPPSFGATRGDYACAEEPRLVSQRTNIETRLIFRNASLRPVQLFWLDYDGRRQPHLSLGPGETGVQPTFFSHPWLVADTSGRCIAIYFARRTDSEIVIGP